MLFGCCVSVAGEGGKPNLSRLEEVKTIGFDYAELACTHVMALDEEGFAQLKDALARLSLPCLCMNVFFPGHIRLTGPNADHSAALTYARDAVARMAALGTRTVVLGSSGARNVPPGTALSRGIDQMAEFLTRLADIVEPAGVTVALEPLNRQETNILNRVPEAAALARRVGRAGIKALADTHHMNLSYEPIANIVDAGPYLAHVHVANALRRGMPSMAAHENLAEVFAALERVGYDGTISLEANVQGDFVAEAADALACLRTLHAQS